MSDEKVNNEEVEEIQEDTPVNDLEEVTEESEEIIDVDAEDEEMKQALSDLDEGNLSLFNREKMDKLLTYILEQDKYLGDYNPSVTVEMVDSMIVSMESVENIPENGFVGSNHTVDEVTEFSKRLWRVILASQHSRMNLSREEIEESYVRLDNPRVLVSKEENYLISYLASSMAVLDHSPKKDSFNTGSWTNGLEYNDRRMGTAVVVNHKDPIKRIRSKLNLVNEAVTQLFHSGLVIKMSSPGALDQALINDNLVSSKIENSLASYGTGLDSTSIYTNEILIEHAYRHIIDSNIGDMSKEVFEESISILDLETLYLTMATAIYPTGFEIFRQCMDDACGNIDKIMINPRRCIFPRNNRLSNAQSQVLTRGLAKSDISVLKEYRETLNPDVSKYIKVDEDIYIKLQVPTVAEYKRISHSWLGYLGEKSLDLMTGGQDEESRRRYISKEMSKSAVMMYSHWIEGIYSKDENDEYVPLLVRLNKGKGITTNAISVADSELDKFLADLSLNDEVHTRIVDGVSNFITQSNIVVIALAKTPCSKCGGEHELEGVEIEHELIAFNAGELFFTLLHQKIGSQ